MLALGKRCVSFYSTSSSGGGVEFQPIVYTFSFIVELHPQG